MREPLVIPFAALAAGVVAGQFTTFAAPDFYLGIGGSVALAILALLRSHRAVAALCAYVAIFFAGTWVDAAHRPGPPPSIDANAREELIVAGCVVDPPATSGTRERFILELEPGARAQVTLYARAGETLPTLDYGDVIELDGKIRKPRNFGNPGSFDYAAYLARQDIYWTISAAAGNVRHQPGRCGSRFTAAIMALRTAALTRLTRLYPGDDYNAGMMQAILIGQSFQLQKVWTEHYRTTGTFHALVISGTHVAVLSGFLLMLLRLLFIPKSFGVPLTVLAAWLYTLVAGWQAPCIRSAAGMTLFAVCAFFYREARILNMLSAVAIAFVVCDPGSLFDASFQLTFLAVAFIGAFASPLLAATARPLARGLTDLADRGRDPRLEPRAAEFRVEMRLLVETVQLVTGCSQRIAIVLVTIPARAVLFVYEIVAISAVVQLGLALPMVVYFHRVGMSGLSANAIVVPLMDFVVPLGFIAIFTGFTWVAKVAGGLLWLSRLVVDWHAHLEPNWRVPTPPVWLGVALAAALIAVASLRGRWRVAATAVSFALLGVLLWHPFSPRIVPGELEMTAIDVGQGDSLLVAFPTGKLMLVDGGGIPSFGGGPKSKIDIGEDVVAPYLWSRSMRRLDVVVMSHAHDDHAGGLPAIINDFRPHEVWLGAAPESPEWDAVRSAALATGARIVPLTAPRSLEFGGASIDVLAPFGDYSPEDSPKNNDSLVLRLRYGRHSFMLSGDAERQVEWQMLDAGELAPLSVLKVAHHGSKTSTTDEFLRAVEPTFAVISCGFENSYGHPHPSVLESLAAHRTFVLRTDRDGLVSLRSNGRRLTIETGRSQAPASPGFRGVF